MQEDEREAQWAEWCSDRPAAVVEVAKVTGYGDAAHGLLLTRNTPSLVPRPVK